MDEVGWEEVMKPPRIGKDGCIPGTRWNPLPHENRTFIPDLKEWAIEVSRVARWCKAEEKWAKWAHKQIIKEGYR